MRQSAWPQAIHFSAASGKCVNQVCHLKAVTYYKSHSSWSDLLGKLQIHLMHDSYQSAESFSFFPPTQVLRGGPNVCQMFTFLGWDACIVGQINSVSLVGHFLLGSEQAVVTQRERERYKMLVCHSHKRHGQMGPLTLPQLPFLPLKSSHGGNTGRGWWVIGNFTENNYPKQVFCFFSD